MPSKRALLAALIGLWATALATLGVVLASRDATPERALAGSYGTALGDADTAWSTLPANVWLSGLKAPPFPRDRQLAVGDTMTIAQKDGRPDVIEVTDVGLVDGDRLGLPGVRFQLVTGRTTGRDSGHLHGTVRFLFAIESPGSAPLVLQPDRSL